MLKVQNWPDYLVSVKQDGFVTYRKTNCLLSVPRNRLAIRRLGRFSDRYLTSSVLVVH